MWSSKFYSLVDYFSWPTFYLLSFGKKEIGSRFEVPLHWWTLVPLNYTRIKEESQQCFRNCVGYWTVEWWNAWIGRLKSIYPQLYRLTSGTEINNSTWFCWLISSLFMRLLGRAPWTSVEPEIRTNEDLVEEDYITHLRRKKDETHDRIRSNI